jgi:ABC-2 type transport system ATP-binding protein
MIKITSVSKTYDGINNVVDQLSLTIPTGSVFGFLGPNGAGKTTTIKMIVGINKPDSGEITIGGKSPYITSTRENIGFMPEEPHFYNQLTGLEFLEFSSHLFAKSQNKSRAELEKILTKSGIYEARNRKIKTYSKGMKQRLGFAQALVNNPSYIFLDEPLEGLDPIGRREMKAVVEDIKKEGKTIFFNSHILADVETLCDQIGIINKGQLVYSGPVNNFKGNMTLEDKFVETIKKLES